MDEEKTTENLFNELATVLLSLVIFTAGAFFGVELKSDQIETTSQNKVSVINPESTGLTENQQLSAMSRTQAIDQTATYTLEVQKVLPKFLGLFNIDGPTLIVGDQILITNDISGEETVLSLMEVNNLALFDQLRGVKVNAQYSLYATLLTSGLSSEEDVSWVQTTLRTSADPSQPIAIGLFARDWINNKGKIYILPKHESYGIVTVDFQSQKVLYETFENGLELYVFDLQTKEERLVVGYEQSTFDKYCSWVPEYMNTRSDFYGECGIEHNLQATWIDGNRIQYKDFVTREILEHNIPVSPSGTSSKR